MTQKHCPAVECNKPIADTSMCCLRHFKQLPYSVRLRAKKGEDVLDLADRIWRDKFYATRRLKVGQWLGTHNRVASLRWTRTYGWIARDSTGAEYHQKRVRDGEHPTRYGMSSWDEPHDGRDYNMAFWPEDPK
jgi:hypothetical protein